MRLAWFTPWPPQPSGVAGRSAELVPRLAAAGHAIDVFVDERRVPLGKTREADAPPAPGHLRLQSAHDFVWRQARGQYDLVVYQVGNSKAHGFLWPYLFRWPGLTVLHDSRLHHARGHATLGRGAQAAYRAEFARNHPDVNVDAAEMAVAGLETVWYYAWPMVRSVVEHSRAVGVHARGAVDELREAVPDRHIEYVALGEGFAAPLDEAGRRAWRARHAFDDSTVLVGVFGGLSAEKRLPALLRAFAATHGRVRHARLVLAGAPDPLVDLPGLVRALDLDRVVHWLGVLDDREFDQAIASVDVSVNLRWPSALETSGPWLRALSAARPTVVVEQPHQTHLPALDPRTWLPYGSPDPGLSPLGAMTVAVDILDEEHSLRLALQRLATDPALRNAIGKAGRRYWEAEHTVDRMAGDYERLLAAAAAAPAVSLPAPVPDPLTYALTLLSPFGESIADSLAPMKEDR